MLDVWKAHLMCCYMMHEGNGANAVANTVRARQKGGLHQRHPGHPTNLIVRAMKGRRLRLQLAAGVLRLTLHRNTERIRERPKG